ncbi:hypothetical protein FPZ42_10715 [Mucilaginibacter achroorhodeus]|uniref:Lipocalin-like domain-containing protein n=1 Tax=Mucilaginibacter achroorhodeus TaxID=2599294 RepID=A0A563U418_9SPHI|nr:hypothetical protein [Mucilaginibacter achroorhodeus]TWR26094.1 hypothetical protein FPZ42_10715 [Mucilaginibacter achroorhodeus]
MKKLVLSFLILVGLASFKVDGGLSGRWEYSGGIYNGKPAAPSTEYTLRRQYNAEHYAGTYLEKDAQPLTYETGDYKLQLDSCFETQTYSAQPSKWLNVTLRYHFNIRNDTLIFNGKLPNGTVVEEYWKRVQ